MVTRRGFLAIASAGCATLLWPLARRAGAFEIAKGEMALGPEDAPVTIIEYFSLTCSHCARFHQETFGPLKETYVDSGKVRMVLRDFPLDRGALQAAMLARCAGPERYFSFVAALFGAFEHWTRAQDPMKALAQIAMLGGLSRDAFEACLANEEVEKIVLNSYLTGVKQYGVESTPTFIINGQKYEGAMSFERFGQILEPILAGS